MKKVIPLFLIFASVAFPCMADKWEEPSASEVYDLEKKEIQENRRYTKQQKEEELKWLDVDYKGAVARLTFHVTDSKSRSVTNANVGVRFRVGEEKPVERKGVTDENGVFVAEGKTTYEVFYDVTLENYYAFSSVRRYYKTDGIGVKDGRWQPWNPTIEITLKKKRNPIPMYAQKATVRLPKNGEAFGYDFMVGDLVAPHGKGKQADLFLMCAFKTTGESFGDYKVELFITAVQQDEGIMVNQKDEGAFKSAYEAQENGYEPQYYSVLERTASEILQKIELASTEYLTFRSRIIRDDEGNIISSHYGKIIMDGTIDYGIDFKNPEGTRVGFTYYFNPTPNDRNIEYDPAENLFDKVKFRGMQP